jgi:transposase
MHEELKRRGVTLMILWEEHRAEYVDGHRFCELYSAWRRRLSPTMRQTYVAGDKLFVDWAGDTVPIIDPMTGEVHEAHLFVAALGASSYTYAEAWPTYRIVVSDLIRRRPIWFGGEDRSQASMSAFYAWLGARKSSRIRLAVMDMWKPFRLATVAHAPQAAILFDKFHIIRHLGEALDAVRKSEYARLQGRERRYIKGQKYTLLSRKENLTLAGKKSLKTLLAANKRLNTAYVLKESFGQLWSYEREGWARRFFENWRASLKWQRLKPYEKFAAMIDRHWDGIAAYCRPENKVSLGFVEGLNNKIRVIQRRAYGLRDEEYLRLKILTCMLPAL